MIIYSFDCAVKNLGVCCIEYEDKKYAKLFNEIKNLQEISRTYKKNMPDLNKSELCDSELCINEYLTKLKSSLKEINHLLDGFRIIFMNIINLTDNVNPCVSEAIDSDDIDVKSEKLDEKAKSKTRHIKKSKINYTKKSAERKIKGHKLDNYPNEQNLIKNLYLDTAVLPNSLTSSSSTSKSQMLHIDSCISNELLNNPASNLDTDLNTKLNKLCNTNSKPSKDKISFESVMKNLKYALYCISNQLPKPDIVLIEHQMKFNDKARSISKYIEEFYTTIEECKISYQLKDFPLKDYIVPLQHKCHVFIVNPGIKNKYHFTEEGKYKHFISKYSNYVANKKHTTYNFKYYLESIGEQSLIANIKKLDDISDAFMMAYGWCNEKSI
jgi:hypothetical protein